MELSPKQQAVNEIKKAKRILVLGHCHPGGDQMGSLLALRGALSKLDKNVDIVVSDKIDKIYNFLPEIEKIKSDYQHTDGKILKIDTKRLPINGMKWQREDDFLNIYLDTDKNLKFEFIEIINGMPRPDLIIVVDTPDIKNIDGVYEKNTALFFEAPILNIDHHPGNEYFGTINLVDLTATSTAEILVSLFEALGIKIDNPDIATCLLTGILDDTQSFRNQNTTPKSLTVAAQLLAAGGRQQDIIKNLFGSKPQDLLRAWEIMVGELQSDISRRLIWTKLKLGQENQVDATDISEAADNLLAKNPESDTIFVIYQTENSNSPVVTIVKSSDKERLSDLKDIFDAELKGDQLTFSIPSENIDTAEKIILKRIAEKWPTEENSDKELWDIMEAPREVKKENPEATTTRGRDKTNSEKEKEDAIEEALKSISQAEKDENNKEFVSLRDVLERKKVGGMRVVEPSGEGDDDIFEDE